MEDPKILHSAGIDSPSELEPDADEMLALARIVTERIAAHIVSLPDQPVSRVDGGKELARSLRESLPETGQTIEETLDTIFGRALSRSYNTASPGYLAFIPGGGIFESALAEFIAAAVNRYSGVWIAAPGLVEIEANVLRWMCEIVGFPSEAFGLLTSGGSMANLIALVAARHEKLGHDFARGTLYTSDQTHHCVAKAAVFAGLPPHNVRKIESDDLFRIRLDRLAERIRADRDAGLEPFIVIGNAGSTNTGAIDDLPGLADLAAAEGLWNHVDAAYGGFFAMTSRGQSALRGLERADSIVLDPHKGLFLPYGTGCLLIRDPEVLRRVHSAGADYMPPMQDSDERVDFCDMSPELSRPWRGLRVWLPLKRHGVTVFRRYLDEKLDLTGWALDRVSRLEHVEIVAAPQLSLFAFRYARPDIPGDQQDAINRRWLERINERQRVFLTGTTIRDRFTLRLCVLSFRTHMDRVGMAIEDLVSALEELDSD